MAQNNQMINKINGQNTFTGESDFFTADFFMPNYMTQVAVREP